MSERQMIDKSCREFLLELSSKAAVPGGGSAAALGGALGAGLANMVASLTVGKKKYAEVEEEVRQMLQEGLALQTELMELVAADAEVFAPLALAYGLPHDSETEKNYKEKALSEASQAATLVPLAIAEKAYQAMLLARRIAEIGSRLAVSDAGCAILFLQAALGAARYNILINLPLIKDEAFVDRVDQRLSVLLSEGQKITDETMRTVAARM